MAVPAVLKPELPHPELAVRWRPSTEVGSSNVPHAGELCEFILTAVRAILRQHPVSDNPRITDRVSAVDPALEVVHPGLVQGVWIGE